MIRENQLEGGSKIVKCPKCKSTNIKHAPNVKAPILNQ